MSDEPKKGITITDQPVYREGETVPVPDKGGWIDGETGPVFPVPAPEPPPIVPLDDAPADQPAIEPAAPSVPRRTKKDE